MAKRHYYGRHFYGIEYAYPAYPPLYAYPPLTAGHSRTPTYRADEEDWRSVLFRFAYRSQRDAWVKAGNPNAQEAGYRARIRSTEYRVRRATWPTSRSASPTRPIDAGKPRRAR